MYEAYLQVRSNDGAAGVDGVTIEQFESDLKSNLYKIWKRMSSGAYFSPPCSRRVHSKEECGPKDPRGAHCGRLRGTDGC